MHRFVLLLCLLLSTARAEVDLDGIRTALAEFGQACEEEAGATWGRSLCGPVLVADFDNDTLVADRADPEGRLVARDGLHTAPLPSTHLRANTGIDWAGSRWTQVLAPLPDDDRDRLRLMLHEAFHRIQPELGMTSREAPVGHLDEADGRYWQRLEWRALAAALSGRGEAAVQAVRDAAAFRRERLGGEGDRTASEWAGLYNEGLAEYTGLRVAYGVAAEDRAVRALEAADGWSSFSRQHAYAGGPAWGLLLDRYLPDWRQRILQGADLDALLAAAGIDGRDGVARAEVYGGTDVASAERRLAEERSAERDRLTVLLMGDDALVLPLREMQLAFDYRDLVKLPPHGTVYRTLTLSDRWGRVEVRGAALINTPFNELRLPAPHPDDVLRGDGWTLELGPGWRIDEGRLLAPPSLDP